jgi:hypothetical protein
MGVSELGVSEGVPPSRPALPGGRVTLPAPTPVRFEHAASGFGIGTPTPRLSWRLPVAPPGFAVTGCELELTNADTGSVTTRRVASAEQVLVPWPFAPLASRARVAVRVRVAAGDDVTPWSAPAPLETTLLGPADWTAGFISPRTIGRIGDPAPVLRGTVHLGGEIVRARLHVTALGLHVTSINGQRVGDEELAPGWTSYAHRLSARRSPDSRRGCSAGASGAVLVHATVVLGVLPLRPGAFLLPAVGAVVAGLVAPARRFIAIRGGGRGEGDAARGGSRAAPRPGRELSRRVRRRHI